MSDPDSVPDGAYTALDSLHDDPDAVVDTLHEDAPAAETVAAQAAVLKALANEKRLRILGALREGERCVCELQAILEAPQSTVATHLRTLKDAGLVRSRKSGRWSYYRVADTAAFELLDLAAAVGTGE